MIFFWFFALPLAASLSCSSLSAQTLTPPPQPSIAKQLENDFVAAFEKIAPTVVILDVDRPSSSIFESLGLEDPENPLPPQHKNPGTERRLPAADTGSGFIYRADGYIVTNFHVVEKASAVSVLLKDGRRFKATLLGGDQQADIAILKIEATNLPAATLGDPSRLKVGQWTLAVGAPFALEYSYSVGWLSGTKRSIVQDQYVQYLQTTAPINPGNSGGPLCNIDGEIIGVNTLIRDIGRGLGFAVPSDLVRDVADQIISAGSITRPWLGIRISSVRQRQDLVEFFGLDLSRGIIVERIEPGTPALSSTLRPGDVILSADGVSLDTTTDLQSEIIKKKVGDKISLDILRPSHDKKTARTPQKMTVQVTLEKRPPHPGQVIEVPSPKDTLQDPFGWQLSPASEADAKKAGAKNNKALQVSRVSPGGAAHAAGVREGDILVELAGRSLASEKDYKALLTDLDPATGVFASLSSGGARSYAILKSVIQP